MQITSLLFNEYVLVDSEYRWGANLTHCQIVFDLKFAMLAYQLVVPVGQ